MVTLRDPHNVPAHISLVLFYGPNEGLVQERRKQLLEQWKQGGDFFDVSFLSCDDLRGQAGRLVNEAASLSLGGQERLVVVDAIDERCFFAIHTFLESPQTGARVILTCGPLKPRSKVRRAVEKAQNAAVIPCYGDTVEKTQQLAHAFLAERGLSIQKNVLHVLAQRLGSDRGLAFQELEKLALYVGTGDVALEHVRASCDGTKENFDRLMRAVVSGKITQTERFLKRLQAQGENAVGILAIAQAHFLRMGEGEQFWTSSRREEAVLRLRQADADFRRTPKFSICHTVLINLARAAAGADTPDPAAPNFYR